MEKIAIVLMCGMLVTGTINTLSKTWQNGEHSRGIDGTVQIFHFPWTQTLIMYCGEAMCMVAFIVLWLRKKDDIKGRAEEKEINQTEKALLMTGDDEAIAVDNKNWQTPFLFLFASSLDLVGTTLGGIGLLYTYASVYQMLRGSIIIFSGILSVFFLKRTLYGYNWLGILITTGGLVLVGWSSLLADSATTGINKMMFFGNLLVVCGQFANAVQFIVEEIYLKKKKFSPLLVVGAEGCWGILLMFAIVLPAVYYIHGSDGGHYENALNAAVMIGNNKQLMFFVFLYWMSIAFYNFFGLSVAKKLTAVHRTFIDALRTVFVWGAELILFYASDGATGEPWTKYSYGQLAGFVLLIIGTATYNAVLRFPFLKYPPKN